MGTQIRPRPYLAQNFVAGSTKDGGRAEPVLEPVDAVQWMLLLARFSGNTSPVKDAIPFLLKHRYRIPI